MNEKIRKEILTLLICFLVFTVNAQNNKKLESVLTKEQKEYLLKFVHPLNTFEPETNNTEDLKILNQLIGDSKVVALGEVTHGSS